MISTFSLQTRTLLCQNPARSDGVITLLHSVTLTVSPARTQRGFLSHGPSGVRRAQSCLDSHSGHVCQFSI